MGSITDMTVVNHACTGVDVVLHVASLIDWRLFPNHEVLQEINVKGKISPVPSGINTSFISHM